MLAVEPDTDAGEIKPVKLPKHALPDGDKPMLRCAACDVDVDIQNVGCLKCHGGLTTDFRLHKTAGAGIDVPCHFARRCHSAQVRLPSWP